MGSTSWDRLMQPEGFDVQFDGHEEMAPFDPDTAEFSPVNAWWLSELCRLVYTPDFKERDRVWNRHKPYREQWLGDRTPFVEVHSFHKTGSHAAIFVVDTEELDPFTILCFRGTSKLRQWIMNLTALPAKWEPTDDETDSTEAKSSVHQGFKILFDRVWPQIEPCLVDLPQPLFITGHSLGGAFAAMAAAARTPFAIYTFGAPRVGNRLFADRLSEKIPAHYRVVNARDIVPLLPDDGKTEDEEREFVSCGKTIHLGGDSDCPENARDALRELARSIGKSKDPPACVLDHLAISYSKKLRSAFPEEGI